MNRELIFTTLFARLQAINGIVTTSRRWKPVKDVSPVDQPALFLVPIRESVDGPIGMPRVFTIDADILIYAHTNGNKAIPASSILNPLIDAVAAAFVPDNQMTNRMTLGGLVEHCWLEGQIETDEGYFGDQGVVVLPVRIRVTTQ